jgi:hypothetical protein
LVDLGRERGGRLLHRRGDGGGLRSAWGGWSRAEDPAKRLGHMTKLFMKTWQLFFIGRGDQIWDGESDEEAGGLGNFRDRTRASGKLNGLESDYAQRAS